MTTPAELPRPWDAETLRQGINTYGPYLGAGIEVTHLAEDFSELRVSLALTPANTNLVGTQFGGSLYAMVDPHLMILLMQRLGPDYVVWDKAARIDFLRPGTSAVHATVRVTDAELDAVRALTAGGAPHEPAWSLDLTDDAGEVVARVHKTLWVRRRPADR
jgi:acyl-coenzyme A thioesterase PaaI-like protein